MPNYQHNEFQPIIYFDGACKLCNRSVNFIIRKDKKKQFRFIHFQPRREALDFSLQEQFRPGLPDSVMLNIGQKFYIKTDAVIRILTRLQWWYKIACLLYIIPRPLRDYVYDQIAKRRYRWFGKYDSCLVPSPEIADRFLE